MRCIVAVIGLLAIVVASGASPGGPSEALWVGQVAVESGGDTGAYNEREGAAGIVQIRPQCLADANRIAERLGLDVRFTAEDRFDAAKSRQIWDVYLKFWGEQYTAETGLAPTDEVYARIWNGGPTGWRKETTQQYWQRVRDAMEAEVRLASPGKTEDSAG